MAIREISFPSANGRDEVKGWVYSPLQAKPKAIVQIVHGFGEHSRRYLHMIGKMQEAGFVVYADDHVAHGKTAADADTWGDPGDKGFLTYIEDEHTLHDMAVSDYPDTPYFMFGHSWGSMIARGYASRYGADLTGLLLCGVVAQMDGCDMWAGNPELQKAIDDGHGSDDGTDWMIKSFCNMTSRFDTPDSPNAWIANDPRIVADHAADPFNNMVPTIQLIYDFLELYRDILSDEWASKVPATLPVYMISGDQDPCGNYGEGLYHVANQFAKSGNRHVTVRSYTGYRHEIHNELEIRDEVVDGVITFISQIL